MNGAKTKTVYTITLTVETEPKRLAESIKKRFSDVVLSYATEGPWEIPWEEDK